MNHQPVQVTFLQPFAPLTAYAVLHITSYLENAELNEYNMRLEGAAATMQRTVMGNDPHALTLEVESRDWEEAIDMLEAAQGVGDEAPEASPLKDALRITAQFLVAYKSALELRDTGEAYITSVP